MTYRKPTTSIKSLSYELLALSYKPSTRKEKTIAHSSLLFLFLTLLLFHFSAFGNNVNRTKRTSHISKPVLADSLLIYGENATGNIGDIVTVNFKADNFSDVNSLTFSLNWNNSLIQFNSVSSVGINNASLSNFDISQSTSGICTFSWNDADQTLPNGTIIFSLKFTILKGGKQPIKINITDIPTPVTSSHLGPAPYQVKASYGSITVLNSCNSRLPGLKCADAPLLCPADFPYCATLPDTNSITNPGNKCGKIDNNVWISFKPATTSVSFNVNIINCIGTKDAADGISISIYTTNDCINFVGSPVFCDRSISRAFSNYKINLNSLTIDKVYYIMIDGNNNDICDFSFDLLSGKLHGNGTTAPTFTNPDSVCAYQPNVIFKINNPDAANQYQWRLGLGAQALLPNPQIASSVKISFDATSDSVCARTITACDTSAWTCKLIPIRKSYNITQNAVKCPGVPYIWNGTTYNAATDVTKTFKSLAGCDSMVTLHLTDYVGVPRVIDTVACGSSFSFLSQTYTTAGSYPLTAPVKNYLGCDSLITLNLTFISTTVGVSKSNDLTCQLKNSQLTANATNIIPGNATLAFEWYNSSNILVKTGNSISVSTADTYTVLTKATYKGVTCTTTNTITVKNIGGTLPPKPIIVSPIAVCNGIANSFSISNTDADSKSVTWTATNATIQTIGLNANVTPTANNFSLCASITNSCGVSDTSCVNLISKSAPTSPDFTGVFTTCPSSTQNYVITQAQTGTTYNWVATNGTIIGASTSSIVQVKWNITDGKICVTAANGCGTPLQICKDVKVSNASSNQNPIVGKSAFCANENLTYSINTSGSDKVQWSLPSGFVAQSKIDTSVLLVTPNNTFTTGKLCVSIVNGCNVKSDTCLSLSISNAFPDSVPISFNNSICSDDTSTFSLNTTTAFAKVVWNLPNGAKIVSGLNTKTIRVVWQNALSNKPLSVAYSNNCNLTSFSTIFVTVKDATINAPNIDGPKLACPRTRSIYSIPQQSNIISYTWHVPIGATIEGKSDSNVVSIFWDTPTIGDVCVDLQNACKVKKQVCTNVEARSTIDSLPINGNYSVCADSVGVYSVSFDESADSYFWKLPPGAKIIAGASTNQIKVKFPSGSSGDVCCYPNGGCADGTKSCFRVTVNDPPALPSKISGNSSVCIGDTVQFSIEPTAGTLGINWRVPKNLDVLAGLFSKTITAVARDTFSGNVCVSLQGNCKNDKEVCLAVLASKLPQPIITSDTSVCSKKFKLSVKASGSVQWRIIQSPTGATASFSQPNNLTTDITTNTGGVFVFGITETNGNCKKEVQTRVKVRESPVIYEVNSQCNTEADYYQIRFKMSSTSAQQYFVNGSTTGSVLGNLYNSFLIKQNTPYWFVVTDESGCTSDTLRGQVSCPCYSKAGNITSNTLTACFGDSIVVKKSSPSSLDRNDTEEYILTNNPLSGTKQILQRNKTGIFVFDATQLKRDTFYTIQMLVGDSLKSGIVDTNARCFAYSPNSLRVNFRSKYTVFLSLDTIVCPFSIASGKFSTNAPANVSFNVLQANTSLGFFNLINNSKLDVRPSSSGYLKLINLKDDAGCSLTAPDSIFINVRKLPVSLAGDDQAICARTTTLNATIDSTTQNGRWENFNTATIVSPKSTASKVSNLENGKNTFVWVVTDKACPTFEVRDSVNIYLPFIPKTNRLALETKVGVPISASLVEEAPNGSYTVTRLSDPNTGRFDFFSNGKFNYIPDNKFVGIVKFRFVICSVLCNSVCDTSDVRILITSDSIKPPDTLVNIEVPNAITPNGDGKNDYLVIDHVSDYPGNELIIFNRWGETVYQAKPYNNDWSGNNQTNSPLPVGTYYYLLRLDVNNGKILKGDITILRDK